ncbi:pyruvate, water dikinase regulatory protein [Alkalilimnicola sp. S0819]|uniref:posphoenolpyruvate synthetase regulatory kinase/phosphorylase PpsR n=1 Tax=Alkalilimnicola sp. S0819 TaxID=2613922 RepID=UPI0012625F1D|nr:pyruvate, water dikinase regulatory protein [Alkalilimnicola sp. S0819]KAB7619757.1 kinase/pyrophosphorylase [Alkalilimnicola sp. S0819]MPQ17521.1 pyruvate, phosphate dikinase/phosphoenolpyruvate synthase regulator [Alkalilimnicola sp. S0819]
MSRKRTVFFVSDRTGITAETLGHSLLTQFEVDFEQITLPFVDNPERAHKALEQIRAANEESGERSFVFSTIVDDEVRRIVATADAVAFDFFDTFISPLERELGRPSSHTVGRSHGMADNSMYDVRIDAMNYALNHDDGVTTRHYTQADLILIGVSRSGKTPACIYFALKYGIYAANYPLTEEELDEGKLPESLRQFKDKLHGLTIQPTRLHTIRKERKPDSRYASLGQCQFEVSQAEKIFRRERIPFVETTTMSIEEICTTILHGGKIKRRLY